MIVPVREVRIELLDNDRSYGTGIKLAMGINVW
jgi:hypothetical protein